MTYSPVTQNDVQSIVDGRYEGGSMRLHRLAVSQRCHSIAYDIHTRTKSHKKTFIRPNLTVKQHNVVTEMRVHVFFLLNENLAVQSALIPDIQIELYL